MTHFQLMAGSAAARPAAQELTAGAGRRSPFLDDLSLQFAIWARSSAQECLDLSCDNGVATLAALERGAHMVAINADAAVLERLRLRVPPERRPRLRTHLASLPEADFGPGCFYAIHASRVLHTLSPQQLRRSLLKFFQWLLPEGKLFLSVLTPSGELWKCFAPELNRLAREQALWPGYIEDVPALMPNAIPGLHAIHLLDERIMRRELELAGFNIERTHSYPLPWDGTQNCCAIVASCQ